MQTVSQAFHDRAQQGIRPHTWRLFASFPKNIDPDVQFGIWDESEWDGGDLWSPGDDIPFPIWNFYDYTDYSDRVVDMEWSREIDFPYSVAAAIADFTLNNYDNFFTPGKGSPIDGFILPKRPVRLYAGFRGVETLQQMVGITEGMPELDSSSKTAQFHAMDFLSEMFSMPLDRTIAMNNVRTDEVLDELFKQFGLAPEQYQLAVGRNRIPFLFFEKGMQAGDAFRQLMQSEMGNLWIDEQGVIRFEQRLQQIQDPVMTFNDSNVDSISQSQEDEIINTVRINSVIRDVQEFQPIYIKSATTSASAEFIIPANDTKVITIQLQDPCLSAVSPTQGFSTSVSWFTAVDATNNPVSSNVTVIDDELRTNDYVMTFQNDNAFAVEVNAMEVWGEPAKQVDTLEYEAYDEDSVTKFGEKVLEIDNDFFGSESNAESFALTVIDAYKDFNGVIEMSVKGDPSLQLGDIVDVDTRDVDGQYKVIKVSNSMRASRASCTIKARKYAPRNWGFFDISLWDGPDLWAP